MDFSGEVPAYVGGTSQTIYIDKDEMCYYQLKLVGLDFVMYSLVQGMWYLDPARTMADGLHEIRNDSDVTNGLMSAVGDGLSVTIFMTGHYVADYGADNEEGPIGSNTNSDPDSPIDNSVAPEFIHLIDDDIRTSDDEFAEALFSMGVRKTRNKVAYMEYSSGEEVDQLLVSQSVPVHGSTAQQHSRPEEVPEHTSGLNMVNEEVHREPTEVVNNSSDGGNESSYPGMFSRCKDTICPRIRTIIENGKIRARNCITTATLNSICEVNEYGDGYVVDMRNNTCSCGYFTLSGIPCTHAVAAIGFLRLKVEDHVHELYKTERVALAYGYGIPALVGRQAWPIASGLHVLPPQCKRMAGRPKKARRKEPAELQGRPRRSGTGRRLDGRGMAMHCRTCGQEGHNMRNCPDNITVPGNNQGANLMPEPTVPVVPENYEEGATSTRRNPRRRAIFADEPERADPIPMEVGSGGREQSRRLNKCRSCGFHGHNSRTCPKRAGVQPVTMPVQNRRIVEREVNVANTGFGVAYFPETGNTYFTTGNATTSGVEGENGVRRTSEDQLGPSDNDAAIIDLTPVPGSQPRSP
ncbi:hypothetical protein LINPERHAP2_LOCUS37420 [Linum perenne]